MNRLFKKTKKSIKFTKILMRSIPSPVVVFFVISVIAMNLLANKTLYQKGYLAIDAGILVSWISFLSMDIVVKHFGPKASNVMSLFAIFVNFCVSIIFFVASAIPSNAAEDYSAFNTIIGGTWFILLSSTIAFLSSAILNNFLNYSTGKIFRKNPDGRLAFFVRSYISTFIAQFFDNFIFAILAFTVFAPIFWDGFSWTVIQCVNCSVIGAFLEAACEFVFSPIGYKIVRKWKKDNVGSLYLRLISQGGANQEQ